MAAGEDGDGTVGKALQVLDLVAEAGRPVRFAELRERSALPKATLYRLLQTLAKQGMLVFEPEGRRYSLGLRLVRFAHAAWAQSSLAPLARPHLDALSRDADATAHLAQLDAGHVLYLDKRNPARATVMFSEAGKIGPAWCTGVGKAMLAHLPEAEREAALGLQALRRHTPNTLTDPDALRAELGRIRAHGVAFDDEEHEPGIVCVAAPILGRAGALIGGVSITDTTARTSLERLAERAPRVLVCARDIAREAADWRFPGLDEREQGMERPAT
jgi:DNA-binding IclR family transcriptional regulator